MITYTKNKKIHGQGVLIIQKTRNSMDYAAHGIDWLAGVNKEGEIYYYKLNTYKEIPSKSFSVNKWQQDGFPDNEVSKRHSRRTK